MDNTSLAQQDKQLDFFDIPSPCRGVCKSDQRGYCQGCYRTRDERFGWLNFSNADKLRIIRLCQNREKRRNATPTAKKQVVESPIKQASLFDFNATEHIDTQVDESDFNDFEL
ncbi:DUF1289 domain-containing protein [Thalassotalea aquiviva]|uniref:DUF1289 domain-containing protein n=1 Tax=Thalassotalea aquiviva TaxID=3242415 RepID=UPI00352BA840